MCAPLSRWVWVLACLGRLRFRCGRLVQARLSSPPSAGLGVFPSASAFSFPLPFQGSPAPGKVCWCWCSLLVPPLLFCVPRLVFLLSNFYPIFILSSHFHFPVILIFTSQPGPQFLTPLGGCVCVEHLNRCKTSTVCFICSGAVNLIPSTAQRRRWFEIVISGLIIPTYLHFWNSNRLS